MNRVSTLIDYTRDQLLATSYFSSNGYTRQNIYRQNLPQKKDPTYPCLVFSWDSNIREIFADIDKGVLAVSVYTNRYTDTDDAADIISKTLHKILTSNPNLTIYKMYDLGGPAEPVYYDHINAWGTTVNFDIWVG